MWWESNVGDPSGIENPTYLRRLRDQWRPLQETVKRAGLEPLSVSGTQAEADENAPVVARLNELLAGNVVDEAPAAPAALPEPEPPLSDFTRGLLRRFKRR